MKVTPICYDNDYCVSYILGEEGGPCLLVDCTKSPNGKLLEYINRHHSALEGVLLTHAHYDHIDSLEDIPSGIPVFMGAEEVPSLFDPRLNLTALLGESYVYPKDSPIYPVEDEDEINLPHFHAEVIETPFHTKGSVCYLFEKEGLLFVGDTIFRFGVGRDDLPGAKGSLKPSSLHKLTLLDPSLRIYPGHGPGCTLGEALRNNGVSDYR